MKNFIILVIVISVIGFFLYSRYSLPKITYQVGPEQIQLSVKDAQVEFARGEPFEIKGYVSGSDRINDSEFSFLTGTYAVVWGDLPIELASSGKEGKFDQSELSPEARKFYQEKGCSGTCAFINNHMIVFAAITENADMYKKVRSIKERDMVSIKGYKVALRSAKIKGEPCEIGIPSTVCITEVVINNMPGRN